VGLEEAAVAADELSRPDQRIQGQSLASIPDLSNVASVNFCFMPDTCAPTTLG
jgi:hypothetical protein